MVSKAKGGKPPRWRPASTPQLPAQQEALTRFSPFSEQVAYVSQAIDRHRLQVYEAKAAAQAGNGGSSSSSSGSTVRSRLLADYVLPNARCDSIAWARIAGRSSTAQDEGENGSSSASTSKRRRKQQSINGAGKKEPSGADDHRQEVVALGLSSGAVHLYSPAQGRVVRILADAGVSTSSAASPATVSLTFQEPVLYACSADGTISGWDLNNPPSKAQEVTAPEWVLPSSTDDSTPVHAIAALADGVLACAHHSIKLISTTNKSTIATYPGHASNITHLVAVAGKSGRFVSAAKEDRIMSVWQAPARGQNAVSRPLATVALEAPARQVSSFTDGAGRSILLVVTTQGRCVLHEVPASLGPDKAASNKPRKSVGTQVLPRLSEVVVVGRASSQDGLPVLDASVDNGTHIRIARLAKLQKMAFETGSLVGADGAYAPQTRIARAGGGGSGADQQLDGAEDDTLGGAASVQRYQEAGASVAAAHRRGGAAEVTTARGLLANPEEDGLGDDHADVEDLDEPSLGQRMRGLRFGGAAGAVNGADEDGEEESGDEWSERAALPTGSLSLGETLTQALHSNDASMLSSCLAHSDPMVIRLSVTRLSGPLALRLLEHCVDRMGRGGKKSTGQLSSARTRGIIEWVRATLTAHTGYLMSLPNLVHRLAQLHATLSNRLAAHDRLLALNGRLELVLSQIELRAAYAAEQSAKVQGVKTKVGRTRHRVKAADKAHKKRMQGREWVEASSDEDLDEAPGAGASAMDVDKDDDDASEIDDDDVAEADDVAHDEEEGDVQDITLGNETLANTSVDSDDEGGEEKEEAAGDEEMDEDVSEEASDESALDEDNDSDDEDDSDDDDDSDGDGRNGLIDDEAESTDGDGDDDEEEE